MNMEKKPVDILLIEDNPDHAELILMVLKENHIHNEVHVEATAEDGLEYLNRSEVDAEVPRPGLILLDIKLPGMSGVECLQVIKNDPRFKTIPIIMLTTSADDKDIIESFGNGANSYVVKPVDYQQFVKVLQELKFYWLITNHLPPST